MTPGGERSRAGGRTCRSRPGGKGLGGNGLGGLVLVWMGLAWAPYFALSLPTAAAAAAAGEASVARAGFFPRLRDVLGVAAWPAEAVAGPAGAAVATPGAPSWFSSAAAAAAGEAPVARAGSLPRVRGVLGVAAWPAEAVSRPVGVAAAAPSAPSSLSLAAVAAADEAPVARAGSAPRFRGVLGVAAWSAEAVVRPAGAAVTIPRAPFFLSSAAAAVLGDAPGSCAGAVPRVGCVPGAAAGAAAWLAGAAVSASCAPGAPSLRPVLPPGLPCPVLPVPWGPRRPCPCPWAPFQPPARVAGPASRPPRSGPPALPPPLALPPAPGLPARAPARPSRALAPSRPPAPSRAVRCLRSAPPPLLRPSWTTRRASRCLCSCGSVTPGGGRLRAGGRTCRSRAGGKGLGGNGLGGLVWVLVGLAWAPYFALSLPTAAAAAAAGEASVARAGFFPRLRDVLGVAAWPAEAVARPAGAAVATPGAPSSFSSAAAAAAGEAPVARAGSLPRVRSVLGVAAWPAEAVSGPSGSRPQPLARPPRSASLLWRPPTRRPWPVRGPPPAFAACWGSRRGRPRRWCGPPEPRSQSLVRPSCSLRRLRQSSAMRPVPAPGLSLVSAACRGLRPGPRRGSLGLQPPLPARLGPPPGAGGGAGCLGGGGGHLGRLRLPGRRRLPDQHRRLRQPPLLALREGLPCPLRGGGGGAGAGPAVVAVVPLGGPIGVCHHCYPGRHAWWQARPSHYLLVHQCRALGSAVRCSAGGGGGGGGGPAVASAPHGRGPAAIHRHWEGRRGSHAAHAWRHSSQSGAGPRALGPRGSAIGVGGSRTRWTPVTAVTSCVRRKVCIPSRAAGAGRGGRGTGVAP